jgi:hypothetical protein
MASPFRVFRKNQKTLLAIAGVAIIFVFVLGDSLRQYGNRGRSDTSDSGRSPKDIAVKWNGGQLTNAELGQLVVQRRVVNSFLRQVEGIGYQAAQDAGGEPQSLRVPRMLGVEQPQEGVEQDVLRTHLMADAARQAGMAVSDKYLFDYLNQLGRGYVSVDMIRQIISSQVGGRGLSVDYVLDALLEEMLARNYLASYYYALETELPEDRWRDWLRLNDRIVVESVAVPAESLLVDVKDPSDAELAAFFNEYKDSEPMPQLEMGIELPSPNPGFAVPRKIATQYLLADFNQFLAKVEDEVTDAEIEKFYEDNKDPHFIRAESVLSEPGDVTEDKAETPQDSAPSSDAQPAPATNDESAREHRNPFRLAAFAEDAPAGSTAEAPNTDAPSEAPADAAPTAELAPPTEKPKDFQPLDEVRDQIRRTIAEAKVSERLEQLMTALGHELNESYTEYFGALLEADEAGKEIPLPPAKLADLTPLAQEHGLVYQKTEPASMLQLRDTPIGASVRPDLGNLPFYYSVFSRDVELYQPIATYDLDNNRYLAMKTEDIPGKVPTLDEVRDQVVRAWKLREAGKLAVKRAEALAKQAQANGGSLAEAFADDQSLLAIKTDPFAYFTIGTVSRDTQQVESFRLSEPDGIVAAGPEFMEKVFALQDGEVAAAPNHDRSIAYVVRIAEHQNTPAELQQAFLAEDYNWYGIPVMARGHFRAALGVVIDDLFKSADVKWVRDPDQVIQPEEETEADAEAAKS